MFTDLRSLCIHLLYLSEITMFAYVLVGLLNLWRQHFKCF